MKSNLNRNTKTVIALKSRNLLGLLAGALIILSVIGNLVMLSERSGKKPVIAFTAQWQSNIAMLSWVTIFEKDSKSFEIERSTDGEFFVTVGSVKAAGNSNEEKLYKYEDFDANSLESKQVYYRLRHVERDGSYNFSKTTVLNHRSTGSELRIKLFPNPATDFVNLEFDGEIRISTHLTVVDQSGKTVHQQGLDAGNPFPVRLNVASWAKGIYIISLSNEQFSATEKLILR